MDWWGDAVQGVEGWVGATRRVEKQTISEKKQIKKNSVFFWGKVQASLEVLK